jgi:limonene-1,2-epoxide hydrolase
MESKNNAKEVVDSFLKALNSRDLKAARGYIDDNVSFRAPDGAPVRGAEAYLNGWKPLGLSYEVKKIFVDGDDVCVLYDIKFSNPPVTLFACGWYQLDKGKISSIRVIFDPRPLFSAPNDNTRKE